MADIQPALAPQPEEGASNESTPPEAPPPAPITEQEVGEYREQDRFLPVSLPSFLRPGSTHIFLPSIIPG